jgi:hypothetical protein
VVRTLDDDDDSDDDSGFTELALSAWAIRDAFVDIRRNGVIQGLDDNGILVDGVQGLSNFDCDAGCDTTPAPSGLDNLRIAGNTAITGNNNGIQIAWGADLLLQTQHQESQAPTIEEPPFLIQTFLTEDAISMDASLWAIQNAQVQISGNELVEGLNDNGILVEGVQRFNCVFTCDTPTPENADLLIAGNGTIEGERNGVHISWGVDLSATAFLTEERRDFFIFSEVFDHSEFQTDVEVNVDLLRAWAVDSAAVRIRNNGLVVGHTENGVEVDGVTDGFTSRPPDVDDDDVDIVECCDTGSLNLVIDDNGLIEGDENGIKLGRGLNLSLSVVGHADGGEGPPPAITPALASLDSSSWSWEELLPALDSFEIDSITADATSAAILGGYVQVRANVEIFGNTQNGILVQGVIDTPRDCECEVPELFNLNIASNGFIWGHENGILLDRGHHLEVFTDTVGEDESFGIGLDGWAIDNATVRLRTNFAIWGETQDGIQVLGVRGQPVGLSDGTQDPDLQFNGDPIIYETIKPNLLIADNFDIEGGRTKEGGLAAGRDGIHLGTGFDFSTVIAGPLTLADVIEFFGGTPAPLPVVAASAQFGGYGDDDDDIDLHLDNGLFLDFDIDPAVLAEFGEVTQSSVDGGTVIIDRNGFGSDPVLYDATIPVALADLDFSESPDRGVIRGNDDGIEVEDDISVGSGVFIWRNMIVGGGDNGVVFNSIGQTDPRFLETEQELCVNDFSTSVTVLNNFIVQNGQTLIDGSPENDAGVQGDGVHFAGAIGSSDEIATAIKIFQNFIARNVGDGVHVESAAGDGAAFIAVNQNFIPSGASADVDKNVAFGLVNEATGAVNANANWWGTADPAIINTVSIGFFANGPAIVDTILTTGIDSNSEIDPGRTELDNFAFQAGTAIDLPPPPPGVSPPPPPPGPVAPGTGLSPFDPEFIRFDPPFLGVPPDTPGDAWYRWSSVNLEFPTDPLAGRYTLGGGGPGGPQGAQGPESIEPAAGGDGQQGQDDCANQFLQDMNAQCAAQP